MELDNSFQGESFINDIQQPATTVKISVVGTKARGHGFTAYIAYQIQVSSPKIYIERRYREFFQLRQVFKERWPGCTIPFIPRKYIGRSNTLMVINERVQYFTYFLNCVAKTKHLYQSEQFQIFLKSKSSDVKKVLQDLPKLSTQQMLERYREAFASYTNYEGKIPLELKNKYKEVIEPMEEYLKTGKIPLVNIKSQIRSLSLKKQYYMSRMKYLYRDGLPGYEEHLNSLHKDHLKEAQLNKLACVKREQVEEINDQVNYEKSKNAYWLLYQVLRLEIDESMMLLEAIKSLQGIQGSLAADQRKVQANEQEIKDIDNKRFTLRTFFAWNPEVLKEQIVKYNEKLNKLVTQKEELYFIACNTIIEEVVPQFKKKRGKIWKLAWKTNTYNQQLFSEQFMKLLKKIS